jgi:hypothetical protein
MASKKYLKMAEEFFGEWQDSIFDRRLSELIERVACEAAREGAWYAYCHVDPASTVLTAEKLDAIADEVVKGGIDAAREAEDD